MMVAICLLALWIAPLAAVILCLVVRHPRGCEGINLIAAAVVRSTAAIPS